MGKRARSQAGTATGKSGSIGDVRISHPFVFRAPPIGVGVYRGGAVSPYTSNYRAQMEKRARSKAETGHAMPRNIS